MGDHEGTLQIDYDDISRKIKIVSTRFGGTSGTLRFNEKSFFNMLLGFTPFWECKATIFIHADSPVVYTTDKILNLSTVDKIPSKTDVIDGSIINGSRQPIFKKFPLHKPHGYNIFFST